MTKHVRNDQGQDVAIEEETADRLGMSIVNGATYRFQGADYRATLEEDASDTMACFQRLPINQVDDEPSLFLDRNDGSICDDTGTNLGDYSELEMTDETGENSYECTNCGKVGLVQSCETCDKMACNECLESAYWSPEPQRCAECAESR